MSEAPEITRLPRPFDADRGAEARALVPGLSGTARDLAAGAGGASPYLLGLLTREADWLAAAWCDPDTALADEAVRLSAQDAKALPAALRQGKRRVALLLALLDLGAAWPLERLTGALTDFADLACGLALRAALAPLIARGKLPGMDEDALETAGGMVVLAMGKMGAGELNYSSDIDLICLFDQDRFAPADMLTARTEFVRATRAMCRTLSEVTGEGYVFRTDLRLRPDPAVTPIVLAMEAAEGYYESLGRTWERAAHIKARPVAGDLEGGARYLARLTPFVWRKHLDFAAIEDAHAMRLAIREHKVRPGPITLPGHDMKLGRGGIREIEFYTQTRQLIAGGRDPSLRVRGTVEGLERLAAAGWVRPDVAEALSDHYRFHRTVEHRVQMVQDTQTHDLPQSPAEFDRLACLMDMETAALKSELLERLEAVHAATEDFFDPSARTTRPAQLETETAGEGAPTFEISAERLSRWARYPALRSARARAILERLRPELEVRLARATRPDEALMALEAFLGGLPAGVQLLSLFEVNPHLIDLVLDMVATSPALADYLAHNAQVLDAVIGGGFFADWPGVATLEAELRQVLALREGDYEAQLDAARRWQKEWHFRIGVHLLRGLVDAATAGVQYGELARAVLRALWPLVIANFALRYGAPPGGGAMLLGMGALGAGQMNARSDLDLIVIYDAEGVESSEGPRPLPTRTYFARLTQAFITALSARMAEGRLYEVDMRLRPSGKQGPVATSLTSFRDYQAQKAWTWEHLALTRALGVAGPEPLVADVEACREAVIARPRDAAALARDVAEMRARIASAKPAAGWLDIKAGPGRLQDIELAAQAGTLLGGKANAQGVEDGLAALAEHGAWDIATARRLAALHRLFWQVQVSARLLAEDLADPEDLGESGRDFLRRATSVASLDDLQEALAEGQAEAARAIDEALEFLAGEDDHG